MLKLAIVVLRSDHCLHSDTPAFLASMIRDRWKPGNQLLR